MKLRQLGIKAGFQSAEALAADKAIGNFFYANGLSFRAADPASDSYYKEMVRAIQQAPVGYVPPNYHKLAGALLDTCHASMMDKINGRDRDGIKASKFGITYAQDGWDSVDHLPLINSVYMTASDGGVYLRSTDTSGKTKNAEYIAALMIKDIYEIGCQNVVLVVTDTCATMKKAWGYVLDEFPWISAIPCVPHCISLLLKDIGQIEQVDTLIKQENLLVSWFSNHQKPLAILRSKVKASISSGCELMKAAATRFGTNTYVGERLLKVKNFLEQTVVDAEYIKEGYKDLPASVEVSNCETITRDNKGGTARKLVLSDEEGGFWDTLKTHVKDTLPLCKFLRRHDSSAASVGKVYNGWFEVGKHLEKSEAEYKDELLEKHAERWDYTDASFFRAAYVVDPEFADVDNSGNTEVMDGFMEVLEKLAVMFEVRRLQELDGRFKEIWKARAKAIDEDHMAHRNWNHYPKYPSPSECENVKAFCKTVYGQLSNYRNKVGIFARDWVMQTAETMPGHIWWDLNGASVPELQSVARILLAQPASASICERINSEFSFVKDRKRNRLSHKRADMLVGLFHNLRIIKNLCKMNHSEPAVGWSEVECEKSGVYKYGVTHY